MAKVMSFTDPYGNVLPASYWKIVQLNLGIADRTANIVLYGYVSKAARRTSKQAVGTKSYSVSGDAFDALMQKHLQPGGPNLLKLAYENVVNTTSDVPAPTADDPNARKNFFDGATDDVD